LTSVSEIYVKFSLNNHLDWITTSEPFGMLIQTTKNADHQNIKNMSKWRFLRLSLWLSGLNHWLQCTLTGWLARASELWL